MTTCKRMPDFLLTLPDRPGELAKFAARLRQADIGLIGLWGYGSGGGDAAHFYLIPENPEQFRNFIASTEIDVQEGQTFYISGSADGGAALGEMLEKIGGAGINLRAIQGIRRDDEFGCFIWTDARDWPTISNLLDT